jgi:hypothetical protein
MMQYFLNVLLHHLSAALTYFVHEWDQYHLQFFNSKKQQKYTVTIH